MQNDASYSAAEVYSCEQRLLELLDSIYEFASQKDQKRIHDRQLRQLPPIGADVSPVECVSPKQQTLSPVLVLVQDVLG